MLISERACAMNHALDEINLLRQAQRHQLMVRDIGEEIDLEIGPGEDAFAGTSLVGVAQDPAVDEQEEQKQMLMVAHHGAGEELDREKLPGKRKKKVVKKWRDEWAETYKWAQFRVVDGTARIFCSVCSEYGRKHKRNPYGNEGSRNMQMSALEEHNNSLLHKEAIRLQLASKDKTMPVAERPVYVKGRCL